MFTLLCVGAATVLVVVAIVAKTCLTKPVKAKKAEKAAIMRQLLALSENETRLPAIAPVRKPRALPKMRPVAFPHKPASTAHPVHSGQGRF
ncbi:MAG TPA: hypothetical protein VHS34_16260 [Terriglobales bacterium]|jgi:hypothetical protein|nr:hypothetical protein [Terriglobales bacterium]